MNSSSAVFMPRRRLLPRSSRCLTSARGGYLLPSSAESSGAVRLPAHPKPKTQRQRKTDRTAGLFFFYQSPAPISQTSSFPFYFGSGGGKTNPASASDHGPDHGSSLHPGGSDPPVGITSDLTDLINQVLIYRCTGVLLPPPPLSSPCCL